MKRIDTHCHFLTPDYVDALKKYDRINEDGFPIPEWNLEYQLEYMEKTGITHAVLSLSTPHQHFGDDSFSADLSRSINEFAADLKKAYPDKFSFAASFKATSQCGAGFERSSLFTGNSGCLRSKDRQPVQRALPW